MDQLRGYGPERKIAADDADMRTGEGARIRFSGKVERS
jgi:hypothetical protein